MTSSTDQPNSALSDSLERGNENGELSLSRDISYSTVSKDNLTPTLKHYVELKDIHPDKILLYRLGDFFECFFEDAITVARLLEITLTGKEGGKGIGRVPMAGVPHHSVIRYCMDLVRHGLSVALCDQVETTPSKGALLRREITRILTPGTIIEEGALSSRQNNWLVAIVIEGEEWGLAIADVSTGEFRVTERIGIDQLSQELGKLEAAEVLWSGTEIPRWCPDDLYVKYLTRTPFEIPQATASLLTTFQLASLDGLGLTNLKLATRAAGGLINYLNATQPMPEVATAARLLLDPPNVYFNGDQLILDTQTRRNLELTRTQRNGLFQGSFLWAIDQTLTAMGGRCLRHWIEAPLMELSLIEERQQAIGEFVAQRPIRTALRKLLKSINDLERLAGRASAGSASARDLVNLASSLKNLPTIGFILKDCTASLFLTLRKSNPELANLATLIHETIIEYPPSTLTEGGLIKEKVDVVLDALRNQLNEQNAWLSEQEQIERKNSGNSNLRLQRHRNFGYYLAVTRSKANSVPKHWIRRQTLANEERFVTPELKAREGKIFQIKNLIDQREYEVFDNLRKRVGQQGQPIRAAARQVAIIDVIAGLAEIAANRGYCCPKLVKGRLLSIDSGRHPVVEELLVEERFISNDVHLGDGNDLIILTGPNASGKSCYLRQIGLLQLMAQMGSWIPAQAACISITDRIFTRVGAVDDLAAGQSTFMVEMNETANILNHATDQSLILLDEIGRGTATFDGLSIAWAVAEHIAKHIRARSIFATHYHELNELANSINNVNNFQVLVQETGEELIFLHKVTAGGASRSYGIEVARLAGVPARVVSRAREILKTVENNTKMSK
uniref:DNA mismatch repair protein n=1 Tax=Paulinella chromatophora TaxID=39717 RepID=B1X4Q4_PAUCH|nr:DNA mismatch repair protein [Paulinella chromatophora]ACB42923.1 DNA mismatch repair protein [Paulinella chromatophora]